MNRKTLTVVTLAWGLVSGASAGTLLGDLATNANKVATSPFASGGDIILNPSGNHYIHIFTNKASAAAFTPGEVISADVLVVGGGGGGGGKGGGGGAGGLVYREGFFLGDYEYAITVGAGGAGGSAGPGSGVKGGNSAIGDALFALGGGRGGLGGTTGAAGSSGGSGGGGGCGAIGAYGTSGQGMNGGNGGSSAYASGGGGGGASSNGGVGGDGMYAAAGSAGTGSTIDILGTSVIFAAGGRGGKYPDSNVAGVSGENGRGIGGGGGSGNVNFSYGAGGSGGGGIVIISYVGGGAPPTAPIVQIEDVYVTPSTTSSVLRLDFPYVGSGADATVAWGYAEGSYTVGSNNFHVSSVGVTNITITGLSPNRKYYVEATVTDGAASSSATTSFTTIKMFSKALTLSTSGGVLTYVVDAASDGAQQMIVMVGPNANSLTNQIVYTEASYLTAGSHTATPFAAEQFGTPLSIRVRHIATVDGVPFTNDTAVLTATLQDAVTYTWNSTVAAGIWQDSANWTSTGGSRGYPVAGSTAVFPAASTNAVTLSGGVAIAKLTVLAAGSSVTIIGNGAALAVSTDVTATGANASLVLDKVFLSGTGTFKPGAGSSLELKHGADVNGQSFDTSAVNVTWKFGPNCRWRTSSGNPAVKGSGSLVEIDDGLLSSNNSLTFSGGTTLRLKGATPGVQARTSFSATATFDYFLPLAPYGNITPTSNNDESLAQQRAPVRKFWTSDGSIIGGSAQAITININQASPARLRAKPAEYCLIDYRQNSNTASQGIYTNCISVTGLRAGEYVYYVKDWSSATRPTRMYVHLESKLGTTIFVR